MQCLYLFLFKMVVILSEYHQKTMIEVIRLSVWQQATIQYQLRHTHNGASHSQHEHEIHVASHQELKTPRVRNSVPFVIGGILALHNILYEAILFVHTAYPQG